MTVVNVSHYLLSDYFFDQVEELYEHLDENITKAISKKIGDNKSSIEDYDDYSDYEAYYENN